MIDIGKDLRLCGITFGPFPVLLEVMIKLIGIFHALDIAAGTGITIPIPGASHFICGLNYQTIQPHISKPMKHIEPRKSGVDNNGVVVGG